MIYLDYSANTPVNEIVLHRFCEVTNQYPGNANSKHTAGAEALKLQNQVSQNIAGMLNILPEEIIYTSGASESNNLAIKGTARTQRHTGKHIISTPLEHPSVSAPLTSLQEQGYEIDMVNIGRDGKVDLEHLSYLLRKDTVLVTICSVDSELGTIQPVEAIRSILNDFPDCRLHLDATQAVGKIPVDFHTADTISFAPHKFSGLVGSGVLVKRKSLILEPLIHGGSGTTLYRSGTPTVALNAAAETALSLSLSAMETNYARVRKLNGLLRDEFAKYKDITINSPQDGVPHILNISVDGIKGIQFRDKLSEYGVCVSVKSACSSDGLPSRSVFAVSRSRKNALSSWRISLSHLTTEEELFEFIEIFDKCLKELRQ
ncbi:MAG: cysteine desulfurase [Clostridia bacterium]|nr:cysteine desulfurase [Clostridia bacterium]MBR2177331.1 cysteine desulfurase [Clostridia bacterium]